MSKRWTRTAWRLWPAVALAAAALAAAPATASALAVDERAWLVSTPSGDAAPEPGTSQNPALSASGRFVAFDSDAPTLAVDRNGVVRDVFLRDTGDQVTAVVSRAPFGPPADGPSTDAALSADAATIAFVSSATNLAGIDDRGLPVDRNGVPDVFVRTALAVERISVDGAGADADGPSAAPDVSADGRHVAFASRASDLVPGDANGTWDVFVRDRRTGTTTWVSRGADGPSAAPAISPDGRFVSFSSEATNLVPGDRNGVADVFLADLDRARIARVSVSSDEEEQDESVADPFVPVSDVSALGHYVVFDSDADNLVGRDTNEATDVFLRHVPGGTTRRISADGDRAQGDNDSFWPTVTPDGRFVGFQSFARNLSRHDRRGADLFVHDRRSRAPALVDVPSQGGRRGREAVRRLLQRVSLSADGRYAGFSSTARNIVPEDLSPDRDVFVRDLAPPRGRVRGLNASVLDRARYRVTADDAAASDFRCTLNGRPFACRRRGRLPALGPGVHVFTVAAGGAGMLWQPRPTLLRFTVREPRR